MRRLQSGLMALGVFSLAPVLHAEEKQGSEFVDNPEWLSLELEEERREKAEAEERLRVSRSEDISVVEEPVEVGYVPGYRTQLGVGLSPLAPQLAPVNPASVTPSMGSEALPEKFSFEFHGYIQGGVRVGIGQREDSLEGQKNTTLHGDPLVPGAAYGWFDHTNTVPYPWAQLNFQFGNDVVRATAILGAWSFSQVDEAAGYFQVPAQLGFNDAYLTFTPRMGAAKLEIDVGAFQERYGAMGDNNAGYYGVPLIASIYGMGTTASLLLPFDNDVTISLEAGFKGDFNSAPVYMVSDQSNEFARAIEGSTYAAHGHLSFDFNHDVAVTGHGVYAFSQDDRGDELEGRDVYLGDLPRRDGTLSILGADARFRMKRFGHLYLGGSWVHAEDAITVSNIVQVLNNGPGRDMSERYWSFSGGGNGDLFLAGAQYSFSVGENLRYPVPHSERAPDLRLAAFGIVAHQTAPVEDYDNWTRLKFGFNADYKALSWLSLAGRADFVMPRVGEATQSYAAFSPQIIISNDWDRRGTLTFQYSGYVVGDDTRVNGDNRVLNHPSGEPDTHLFALFGTLWW